MSGAIVIGGGYSGLAAALTLADAGMRPVVLEAGPVLGGRARGIRTPLGPLDNGQHILLGAYHTLLGLIDRLHPGARPYRRLPLSLIRPGALELRAPALPAPLHLLAAMLGCRGLPWRDRLAMLRFWSGLRRSGFRVNADTTVETLLAGQPADIVAMLWEPLCVAALNTRPQQASARVFLEVLRLAFDGRRGDSDLVLPAVGLGALFPDPAQQAIERAGGRIDLRCPVLGIAPVDGRGWRVRARDGDRRASTVIVATGPHQVAALFGDAHPTAVQALLSGIRATGFEPIVTVYLRDRRLPPLPFPMIQLDGDPGEWLIDRGALGLDRGTWAVVTSAAGALAARPRGEILARTIAQLRRSFVDLPEPERSFVITERRATARCSAGRPALPGPVLGDGLYVAGDYLSAQLPPTLETAVVSGVECAAALLAGR